MFLLRMYCPALAMKPVLTKRHVFPEQTPVFSEVFLFGGKRNTLREKYVTSTRFDYCFVMWTVLVFDVKEIVNSIQFLAVQVA